MSPNPEYYLNALREFSSPRSEQVEQWRRSMSSKHQVFDCRIGIDSGEEHPPFLLHGLIEPSLRRMGYGRLIIPTLRIDKSPDASTLLTGINKEIAINRDLIGEGNPVIIRKLFRTNIPVQGSELVLNNGKVAFASDSTNQRTTTLTGVIIDRDWRYGDNASWRMFPSSENKTDLEKYAMVSANGFVDFVQSQILALLITPTVSSSREV